MDSLKIPEDPSEMDGMEEPSRSVRAVINMARQNRAHRQELGIDDGRAYIGYRELLVAIREGEAYITCAGWALKNGGSPILLSVVKF